MKGIFYGVQIEHDKKVNLTPVLCADGMWRWCVASFEDIDKNTPAFIACADPETLFTSTDGSVNPENYGEQ